MWFNHADIELFQLVHSGEDYHPIWGHEIIDQHCAAAYEQATADVHELVDIYQLHLDGRAPGQYTCW